MSTVTTLMFQNCKAGDEVVHATGSGVHLRYVITKIEKRTPTRIIVMNRSYDFDGQGAVGGRTYSPGSGHLLPATPANKALVSRYKAKQTRKANRNQKRAADIERQQEAFARDACNEITKLVSDGKMEDAIVRFQALAFQWQSI